MKRLTLAVLMVALMCVPAFAGVQNVKVSGDIDASYIHRSNFDLGAATTSPGLPGYVASIADRTQSEFITQTRVRIDADLTDNVSTTVGLINERPWDADSTSSSDIDLNLAYVTLREMLYSPLTVVVGRQSFKFGNSFIFDTAGTNNAAPADSGITGIANDLTKQTAQDSIRAILDYKPLTIQVFYSTMANTNGAAQDDLANDDTNIFGANATYEMGDKYNSQVEGYFFTKIDRSTSMIGQSASDNEKADTIYLPGLRASTNPIKGLNVQAEIAWQTGTKVVSSAILQGSIHRNAMAGQFIANYEIPALQEYKPMAQYVYTYTSGDHNPSDTAGPTNSSREYYTAWDPFYENQAGGTIYNSIFNLTNSHIHTISLSAVPLEDVTTKVSWTGLWLAQDSTNPPYSTLSLVQPNRAAISPQVKDGESMLGSEFDWETNYAYTEDVTIGANLGWFVPGDFFREVNEKVATQAIVHMNVNF